MKAFDGPRPGPVPVPSHLQVAVPAHRAAPPSVPVAAGRAVEEVAVVIAAAVLVQNVPHLGLEERHVHVYGNHLRDKDAGT